MIKIASLLILVLVFSGCSSPNNKIKRAGADYVYLTDDSLKGQQYFVEVVTYPPGAKIYFESSEEPVGIAPTVFPLRMWDVPVINGCNGFPAIRAEWESGEVAKVSDTRLIGFCDVKQGKYYQIELFRPEKFQKDGRSKSVGELVGIKDFEKRRIQIIQLEDAVESNDIAKTIKILKQYPSLNYEGVINSWSGSNVLERSIYYELNELTEFIMNDEKLLSTLTKIQFEEVLRFAEHKGNDSVYKKLMSFYRKQGFDSQVNAVFNEIQPQKEIVGISDETLNRLKSSAYAQNASSNSPSKSPTKGPSAGGTLLYFLGSYLSGRYGRQAVSPSLPSQVPQLITPDNTTKQVLDESCSSDSDCGFNYRCINKQCLKSVSRYGVPKYSTDRNSRFSTKVDKGECSTKTDCPPLFSCDPVAKACVK